MRRRTCLAAGSLLAASAPARAWPPEPLRMVVAYPPGGISDRIARLLARGLQETMERTVVVENRAGAGGSLALQALARGDAAGRALVFCAISPLALSPHLGAPRPRVAPVAGVMRTPMLLVGTPALGARDFAAMLTLARARPGELRWATSGVGTVGHLVQEQVCRAEDIAVVHVPYSGGGPQLQDALAGRFELLSSNLAPLQLDYLAAGRLTPLALGAPGRASALPGLPTFTELGCPQANHDSLFGVFAHPDTDPGTVRQLHAACARVLATAALREPLLASGNFPYAGSSQDFADDIALQYARNEGLFNRKR